MNEQKREQEFSIHPFSLWNWMDGQTKETRETQETIETKERSRTMTADTDFAIVPFVSIVPIVSKKVYTRYVIVDNNIYQ